MVDRESVMEAAERMEARLPETCSSRRALLVDAVLELCPWTPWLSVMEDGQTPRSCVTDSQ
jgi:hypothetical protein